MIYKTLAQLVLAYHGDNPPDPIMIDNDVVVATRHDQDWVNVEDVYCAHPEELLEQALDLLGIPWEHV